MRRVTTFLAIAYPVALFALILLFRYVGEDWWISGVTLFLPRWGFALPLPFVVGALLWQRRRRLLALQLVSVVLLVFPLMGLVVSLPRFGDGDRPSVRVLSFNVNSCYSGVDRIAEAIVREDADIVLVQELFMNADKLAIALSERYPHVEFSTQFLLASRHHAHTTVLPPKIPYGDELRSPRFLKHVISTPLGELHVYNVHPISPRSGLYAMRGSGLRAELRSGRLLSGTNSDAFDYDNELRRRQIEAAVKSADSDGAPSILAGDLNLPGLSRYLAAYLSDYDDGFQSVGFGFGYTFPDRWPWLRLDRVYVSPDLEFRGFRSSCAGLSDHRCVIAEVTRR